eukprot:3551145-Ditylum_brightwellii.AAC.1
MFQNDLDNQTKKYRKSFRELTMLERQKWVDGLVREVLCNCLDKDEYKTDGVDYIEHNVEIATDVINILSALEERLKQLSMIKLKMTKEKDTAPTSNSNEGLIKKLGDDTEKAAYTTLDKSTGRS